MNNNVIAISPLNAGTSVLESLTQNFPASILVRPPGNATAEVLKAQSLVPPHEVQKTIARINDHLGIIRMSGRAEYLIKDESEWGGAGPIDSWKNAREARAYLQRKGLKLTVEVLKPGEKKPTKVDCFEQWLNSPRAEQFSGTTYRPAGAKVIDGRFNIWRGWGIAPKQGDNHQLFLQLLRDGFCNGNVEYYNYLIRWLAHMVQKPEIRPETAIVIQSKQGTGKGTFTGVLTKMIGERNCAGDVSNKDLLGGFNSKLANKLLVNVNEATFSGNHDQVEVMKKLITDPVFRVEFKGYEPYDVPNYTRLIVTTNNVNWGRIDLDDRRYLVLEPGIAFKEKHVFFDALHVDMYERDGVAHLFNFLRELDISDWKPNRLPQRDTGIDTLEESMNADSSVKFLYELAGIGFMGEPDPASGGLPKVRCGSNVRYGDLYGTYLQFCKDGARLTPQGQTRFSKALAQLGMTVLRSKGDRYVWLLEQQDMRMRFYETYLSKFKFDWDERFDGKPNIAPSADGVTGPAATCLKF